MAPIKVPVFKLLLIISILLLPAASFGCPPAGYVYNEKGAVECGADGEPIVLFDNPDAVDPTFEELVTFLQADPTDLEHYIKGTYVCADFAEEVHNNAEAAGIRTAWVGISFDGIDIGHAINAFETTDRGMVYIDCTGSSNVSQTDSRDMIAYICVGSQYGVMSIERILESGYEYYTLQYAYYEQEAANWREYRELLIAYNEEVAGYNAEIAGKTYIVGSPEEREITAWERELIIQGQILDTMEEENGGHWYESEFSSYTVSGIQIYW